MRLYRPTAAFRATVSQEIREVLAPDASAPPGSIRRVQILVPLSPLLYCGLDVDPAKLGPNNVKRLPELASGAATRFDLMPGQNLVLAADLGYASPSLIVEYIENP